MPEIPKVLHRIWFGGPIPGAFEQNWESWRRLHPDWELRTWGIDDLDVLINQAAFDDAPKLSSKANIARYEILLRHGGVYVDCDFEALRNIEPLLDGASFVVGEETPGVVNNAFIGAVPDHPVLRQVVADLPTSHFSQPDAPSPQRSGPYLLNRVLHTLDTDALGVRIVSRELLYPYTWDQPDLASASFPEAYAVHHWALSWRDNGSVPATSPASTASTGVARLRATAGPRLRARVQRVVRVLRARGVLLPSDFDPGLQRATYVGRNRVLVQTAAGHPILAFADDLCATPALIARGVHDEALANFLDRELRIGDVVVDVGANIGLVTIHAAHRVGLTGRVLAFEPNPDAADLLTESLYMNKTTGLRADVTIDRAAVGATPGSATLAIPRRHRGRASLDARNVPDDDTDTIDVPIVSLDERLAALPRIDLVKIDVEGAELDVLRSLTTTLDHRRIRVLCLELDPALAGPTWPELRELLGGLVHSARATFTINPDGTRRPMTIGEATHAGHLSSWCLELT